MQAVSSDLVASMVMKPIGGGVHLKKGTVNLRLVGWLVIGSVPAAFLSVWGLQQFADPEKVNDVVQWAVGVALLLASLGLAVKGAFSGPPGRRRRRLGDVTPASPAHGRDRRVRRRDGRAHVRRLGLA